MFENLNKDCGRVIIPFINSKKIIAVQGRSINKNEKNRYITIVFDQNYPVIFNIDSIDFSKPNYCFEGPFDSMFIDNSFSSAGGELSHRLINSINFSHTIIVYDNEPRSIETKRKMLRAISQGFRVCVWPESIVEKDVNQMIINGLTIDYIQYIIDNNSFKGINGEIEIKRWSKI